MQSKVAFLLYLLSLTSLSAWGIDLTGTWEGKQVCRYFDGRKSIVVSQDVIQVSHVGDDVYFSSELVGGAIFHTQLFEDDRHPGKMAHAIFIECDTTESSTYQELGRATKLQTTAKGGGLWQATSNFYQLDEDRRFMGTCSWTYRRVDTSDPNIGACGQAGLKISKAVRPRKPPAR
jgi:hypothetical protein